MRRPGKSTEITVGGAVCRGIDSALFVGHAHRSRNRADSLEVLVKTGVERSFGRKMAKQPT